MKTGFKKLFNKKKTNESEETVTPADNYTAMSSNSLYSLPVPELVSIIFKFDQEVKSLNKDLTQNKDQLQSTKSELSKLQEESSLYKENKETLQLECNRLARELNEAVTFLDSKQAQLDLFRNQLSSREELLNNYKSRIADLEKQNCDLQLTGINLTDSSSSEIEKLRQKIAEANKQDALIHDLNLKSKSLEAEVNKLSAVVADDREQLRMWREKTNIFENARKEAENELNKKKVEIDELRNSLNKLSFLKESAETENRSLKESVSQKEIRIQKKIAKIETLTSSNSELQQQVSVMRFENEMIKKKFLEDLESAQDKARMEKQGVEVDYQLKIMKINEELSSLKEQAKAGNEFETKFKSLENENFLLSQQLTNTLTESHEKQRNLDELSSQISKLQENLETSNKKRELAKGEIMKLTQKLEVLQKTSFSEPSKVSKTCSQDEMNVLTSFKTELDSLYKSLINLIYEVDKDIYKVKIVEFTSFEKRMNNVVMNLHEQIDEIHVEKPQSLTVPQQVAKAIKGRTPIKLFSCIADQDDAPPRMIPKPKRPPQQPVDSRMILRRGSAN
jgi:chromosome segregation ATPase